MQNSYVSWQWRVIQRKYNSWEICIFLIDAIDLKQSVEGTLKVYGKSLTTVLNEVHSIVNLYSFPFFLVPQANPSFSKVSHFPPSKQNNFQNCPFFFLTPFFEDIAYSQVRINKIVNSLDYHPCPWRLATRIQK